MRDSKAEFEFVDFTRHSHDPRPLERLKNSSPAASAEVSARPMPTDAWWLDTQALPRHRRDADRANRLVAYGLIGLAIATYIGISLFMGWGPFRP